MQDKKGKKLWELFLTFMKIGGFTFGGGYAMIPLIQKEAVEDKKWVSAQDILDIVAIAESTPGPIAINTATFIGFKTAGYLGAMAATLGVVLPSFVVIVLISLVLQQFESLKLVQYAFAGIRAGVLALIVKALVSLYRQCPKSYASYGIMAGAFLATAVLDISVLPVLLCCAGVGLAVSLVKEGKK